MDVILEQNFRVRVREAMELTGMTQRELAKKMGVTAPYVHIYLKGISAPGLNVVERFASALEIDPLALLGPNEIEHIAAADGTVALDR